MRILLMSYDYRPRLGGVATCAFELARAMAALPGVEMRVAASDQPGGEAFDRHGFFATVRRRLPRTATRAVIPLSWWLRGEVARWRPDAVVSLLWQPCGLAAWLGLSLRAGGRPPYFVLAHGVEVIESRRNLKKRLRASLSFLKRIVFRGAAAVFPVSRFTAELVVTGCGVPRRNVIVVHNGVDTETFLPGPKPADLVERYELHGRTVLLTVSRLERYKGIDRALGALRYVVAIHPEVTYLICGDGPDRPRLEALVRRFRLEENVIFAGALPSTRLPDHYRLADCFVLLSREDLVSPDFEGFGLVFLEAAACEKPSIAGRSGGIPDAVEDGETGWLVDPEDEYAISKAMRECLENPEAVAARGRAARARAVARFTWSHMARAVLEGVRASVRDQRSAAPAG